MYSSKPSEIKRVRLADQVVERLRDMILSDRLRPGEYVPQDRLAAELGVSRTPLREALVKLQQEGLVRLSGTRGAEVTTLDPPELLELYDLREVLDGLAARLAAEQRTPEDIEEMRSILDNAADSRDQVDVHAWYMANIRFHEAVYRASNSRSLLQLAHYITRTSRMAFRLLVVSPQRIAPNHHEHVQIFEAILAGDVQAAESAARLHIVTSKEPVRQLSDFYRIQPADSRSQRSAI